MTCEPGACLDGDTGGAADAGVADARQTGDIPSSDAAAGAGQDSAPSVAGDSAIDAAVDAGCGGDACAPPAAPTTWPSSRAEALGRSAHWDPGKQVEHSGDLDTTQAGQLVENLRIVGGRLRINHDNVKVRNVSVTGLSCDHPGFHGANYPVHIQAGVTGVVLDGIDSGPEKHCWMKICDRWTPVFPATNVLAGAGAQFSLRNCALKNGGDGMKFVPGGTKAIIGTIEDCFVEIARGIWKADPCKTDHTDSVQVQAAGPVKLTFRRLWMDALAYTASAENGPITQMSNPGGGTTLQLKTGVTGSLRYDTVRLHSGNASMRLGHTPVTLHVTDSHSVGNPTYGPILHHSKVTIGDWANNFKDGGAVWKTP